MIIAQGGAFGGWSLYAKDGKQSSPTTSWVCKLLRIEATAANPSRKHQVRMEFAYDGGGLAKGGNVTLYYDGKKVGEGRVETTQGDDLLRGRDDRRRAGIPARPVSPDYTAHTSGFNGKVNWVQIDLGKDAKTPTTTLTPTNASASRWLGSRSRLSDWKSVELSQGPQLFQCEAAPATGLGYQNAGPQSLRARGLTRFLRALPPAGTGATQRLCAFVDDRRPPIRIARTHDVLHPVRLSMVSRRQYACIV